MNKFQGIEMLGGKVLNGGAIYSEAVEEIKEVEALIRSSHELPPEFLIG
jgi:hypothetical protein